LSWAIDHITDRANNYISFSYEQDATTGEHRPTFVRYGGVNLASHAAIAFSYGSRPDAWKRYVDEARNDLRSLITDIKTYVGSNLDGDVVGSGTVVRDYALAYETSPTSGRSLLDSVIACARNPQTAQMDCLPATTFAWGKPDPSKTPGFESKGIWPGAPILTTWNPANGAGVNNSNFFSFSDFENSGYTDVLEMRIAPDPSPTGQSVENSDNMGNPLVPGTTANQYRYFHNTGSGFTQYTYKLDTGENFNVYSIGDFNGDGAPDLLVVTPGGVKTCLSPLGQPGGLPAPGNIIVFTCGPSLSVQKGSPGAGFTPYVVDLLGDGRADFFGGVVQLSPDAPAHASLCIQGACTIDATPPLTVLNDPVLDLGSPNISTQRYVNFDEMIDFTGSGKSSDLRWSAANLLVQTVTQEGNTGTVRSWLNLTPQIVVTSFTLPGVAPGTDQLAPYVYHDYAAPPINTITDPYVQTPYVFDQPTPGVSLSADFNGSGYQGLMFGFLEYKWMPNSGEHIYTKADTTLCLSTGRAFDCSVRQKFSGANYQAVRAVGNFVGDGAPSILVETMAYATNTTPVATKQMQMCRLMGDIRPVVASNGAITDADANMNCQAWPGASLLPALPQDLVDQTYFMDLLGTGRTQMVLYHSGTGNTTHPYVEDGRWEVFAPIDVAKSGEALDRIVQVTNGLGATALVQYVDGLPSGVVSKSGSGALTYPQHPTGSPGKVVSQLIVSNGVSPSRSVSYRYQDAATDVAGRGSLGFAHVTSTDDQTGIVTTTDYAQAWPYTGMEQGHTVTATANRFFHNSNVVLEQTSNTLALQSTTLTGGAALYPYVQSSQQVQHNDGDGSPLPLAATCIAAMDNYGNATQSLQSVSATLPTPPAPCQPGTYTTTTVNSYLNSPGTPYLIGLVTDSAVTKTGPGQAPITRTMQFDYFGVAQAHTCASTAIGSVPGINIQGIVGMVQNQVVEACVPALALQTSYGRDGFGNVNQTSQTWIDPVAGTSGTRIVSGATYDANGRYPQTVKNATCFTVGGVCQSETHRYDAATGAKTSVTDSNNLTTSWTANGFGRVLTETHPDHTQNVYYQKQCAGACPSTQGGTPVMVSLVDHVTDSTLGGVRIAVPELTYADSAGHHLRSQGWGFDPVKAPEIDTDVTYDGLGRPYQAYHPAYAGDALVLASTSFYDNLNRVIEVDSLDENNATQTSTTAYHGLTTVFTNQKGQQKTEIHDPLGQLFQTIDAMGNNTLMTRDAFGNLLTTQTFDANNHAVTVTVGYDILGRKTSLQDPDLGLITYGIDPRGLQYKQTNPIELATGKVTTFAHDVLDRLVLRTEPDLVSYWVYDQLPAAVASGLPTATVSLCNSATTNGKLVEAYTWNGPIATGTKDYDRVQCYDGLGRPVASATNLYNNTYTSSTGYDSWSRTVSITHQAGNRTPKVFAQYYNGNGYLAQVARITNSGTINSNTQVLWQATQQDAADRVLHAALGNGLTVNRSYFATTGLLADGDLTNAANNQILHEGYFYDVLSNVTERTQFWNTSQSGYTEDFIYDKLNRLSFSQVKPSTNGSPALQSFNYDSLGNITGKTGVGSGVAGSYHYGGAPQAGCASTAVTAGAHAVTAIDGYSTFCFDANGNLLSGGNRSMTWNSFDMPVTISNGTSTSTFIYGPEHQRTRQIQDGANIVYADAMEMDIPQNGTTATATLKTYWPLGLGVEIDAPNSTSTQLRWTHSDRLGSIVAITNESGTLAESMAFDAWGSRRNANGDPGVIAVTANGQLDGQAEVDNKGFTGQEMLDKLALVHLNGRVYDPLTARFLSGDPEIQDPTHSQSYNRYTYVWNNPTNITDPTGFAGDCKLAANCESSASSLDPAPKAVPTLAELKAFVAAGGTVVVETAKDAFTAVGKSAESAVASMFGGGGSTGQKIGPNATMLESAKTGGAANSGTVNLTANDILTDHLKGAGNAAANAVVGFANLMMAIGDVTGDAEPFPHVQPFTPKSNYFAAQGGAIFDGLSVVTGAGAAGKLQGETEVVYRWMSQAELKATEKTGLLRGGRDGTHFVTDAANSDPVRARMRTALEKTPEVRVKMEVPAGKFSPSSKVSPAHDMPGGGSERTATGNVPVKILEVH
jgi:RHS repeat-associated protein